jgi:hypothetical protein
MTRIQELHDVIRHLHGARDSHLDSVPVIETFQGQTLWNGVVEVFPLKGHPKTDGVYGWIHSTHDPMKPKRHVPAFHIPPVVTIRRADNRSGV